MKKILFISFIFSSFYIYAQTWTESSSFGGRYTEWTVINYEEWDHLRRQNIEDRNFARLLYTDEIEMRIGNVNKVLSGTRPTFNGYYYLYGKWFGNIGGWELILACGNSNTGRLEIRYPQFATESRDFRAGSNEYIELYNRYVRRLNYTPEQRQREATLLNQANTYLRNSNYDRAITDFTEVIKINPNNAEAYNGRGLAIWHQDRMNNSNQNRAITDFTEAIRLNSNYAEAYYNRGQAERYWRGWDENINRALADYTRAIRINPNYTLAYWARAEIYHINEDFRRAISDYEAILRINPNDESAKRWLDIARKRGRWGEHTSW